MNKSGKPDLMLVLAVVLGLGFLFSSVSYGAPETEYFSAKAFPQSKLLSLDISDGSLATGQQLKQ
ncbi:hypothetical protein [Pelagibaculum spongiae]|uniref:Uncharacterized protein n=1 Tax=Pelagibaculum spongiae TaxID=2080658 RepID=A0A2V1GZ19_9GAMM|nr:hypothetical protein [Pelagibaculum spongiae]PVZ72294.1 hypothetical protein DC094_04605 [Pelagibaculum spongiae]